MLEINGHTAADYVRAVFRLPADEPIEVCELAGGVSNAVLRVAMPNRGQTFVVKQARGRLRVKEEWLCPVERIWREVDVLRICRGLLAARGAALPIASNDVQAMIPEVLLEDRENFLYAMTAAPSDHATWKQRLLAGETDSSGPIAIACGVLLGSLHAGSWADAALAGRLADRTYFEQLRLDPYYRQVARVHPDVAPAIERLIDSIEQHPQCLVHGDFSPKNLLVWPGCVMLIDFEVGHYGDPAFDLGFFLTHLILKSIWAGERRQAYLDLSTRFWRAYNIAAAATITADELASIEQRMLLNLAGCLLARVDGKSPVDYLSTEQQAAARQLGHRCLTATPASWGAFITEIQR